MTQVAIAEETRYRKALEKALQPYESYFAFAEKLAYWENPVFTLSAVIAYSLSISIFASLFNSTTTVTFLAIIASSLLIGWRFGRNARFSVGAGAPTKGSLDNLISLIVRLRFGTTHFVDHSIARLQTPDGTKYLVKLLIFFVAVAFIGSFLHLSTLVLFAGLGLLIAPGFIARGFDKQIWVVVEPHWKQHWPKVAPKVLPIYEVVNGEVRNILALDAAPIARSTSSPAIAASSTNSASSDSLSTASSKKAAEEIDEFVEISEKEN